MIGEPTNLDFAIAQRGLMMVDLVAEGDQRHAGYAAGDGEFTNAALVLARDLLKLDGAVRRAAAPDARPRHRDADDARGGREPERHAAGREGGARRPQHAGLDPRGARRRAAASRSAPRWW